MKPKKLILSDKALEALSYVIVTATEGGHYTRDDFRLWTTYVHKDTDKGFYAEVTVHPHDDLAESPGPNPIRLTPEELGQRLWDNFDLQKLGPQMCLYILRLFNGDEDVAGEMDVVDSGNALQIAVYGEVVFS